MDGREIHKQVRHRDVVAYGCVTGAIIFIFALTLGAFDPPDQPRDVAANYAATRAVPTP